MVFIIGITGGSASGKTLLCHELLKKISEHRTANILSEDNFYYGLPEGISAENYDFDCPESINFDKMYGSLMALKNGEKEVKIPTYNFNNHKSDGETTVKSSDVIIVEGILLFSNQKMCSLFDLKIFVDASPEIRFARRIVRDMKERGRILDSIIHTYLTFVKPSYDKYIAPTKYFADLIINNQLNDGDSSKINIVLSHVLSRTLVTT